MAAIKQVWGIDLGQCALKAICIRAEGDKVQVVDHFYHEHRKILSQPDVDRVALIDEAMKQFQAKHDLSNETLFVAVPGQHTLARFSKLPPVEKKKIPDIVKYEAQQQVPFDLDEVIWDYQVFEDPDGLEPEVGIFAMRRELLREHMLFLSRLNLEPGGVQAAPLALYNALRFDGLCGSEPVAILDIGAQNTDLIVADGNSLWTRNIPIGGNNFTEALLKTFKLSFRKAENLKRDAAKSKYARQIFQAMRPVFADLVAEVQRSIGFFTSSRRGVKLSKLIAMGSAFKLPGMQKFVQQNIGMDVVRPSTFNKLSASEAPNAPQLMDQFTSFAVAYGLALQGLEKSQITSNLLPPEIARQIIWRKKTPWFYGAAACLVLSAGIIWGRNLGDAKAIAQAKGNGSSSTIPVEPLAPDKILDDLKIDPRVSRIINAQSDRSNAVDGARELLAAGQYMKNVLNLVEEANATLRARVKELNDLHSQKSVWPRILNIIHASLPPGNRQLADAWSQGPDAYKKLVQSDPARYDRAKREQLFIEDFSAEYSPDVITTYQSKRLSKSGRSDGRVSGGADSVQPLKGFVITIVGRTPNGGGYSFINQSFLASLAKAQAKGVYIYEPYLLRCDQLKSLVGDQQGSPGTGLRRSGMSALPRRGMDTGPTGTANSSEQPSKADVKVDLVTGELIQKDWEFEIILAAVLGDKIEPKQDAAGQGQADGNQADGNQAGGN